MLSTVCKTVNFYQKFYLHSTVSLFSGLGDKQLKLKIKISASDVKYKIKSMLPYIVDGKVISVRFQVFKTTTEEEVKNQLKMVSEVAKAIATENEVEVKFKVNKQILHISGHAKPEAADT